MLEYFPRLITQPSTFPRLSPRAVNAQVINTQVINAQVINAQVINAMPTSLMYASDASKTVNAARKLA